MLFRAICTVFFLLHGCAEAPPPMTLAPPAPSLVEPLAAVEESGILTSEDVVRYAGELDFSDPKLVAAIASVESDYQPEVKSRYKGITYYGLMQISYQRAHLLGFNGKPRELLDWRTNVRYAAKYLKQLFAEHGTVRKTIAAYNAGTVYYCQKRCPKGQFVNETYVQQVLGVYKSLARKT